MKKYFVVIAMILAALLCFSACSKDTENTADVKTETEEAAEAADDAAEAEEAAEAADDTAEAEEAADAADDTAEAEEAAAEVSSDSTELVTDYGESELMTEEDLQAAEKAAMDCFNNWSTKCQLQKLSYAGDEISSKGLEYCNTLTGYSYEKCIVFLMDFMTPSDAHGFTADTLYEDWQWLLVYENDEWIMFSNGHLFDMD